MVNILENKRIRNSINFFINFLTQWNVEYSRNRSGLKYFRPNLVTILLIQVSLGMILEYQYIDCHQSPANTWKLKITKHQNLTAIFAVTHQLVITHIRRYELLDIVELLFWFSDDDSFLSIDAENGQRKYITKVPNQVRMFSCQRGTLFSIRLLDC